MDSKTREKLFPTISNKTVRGTKVEGEYTKYNENYRYHYQHKDAGELIKTNRGYFLDGRHISGFSAQKWLHMHQSKCKEFQFKREKELTPRFSSDEVKRRKAMRQRYADQGWPVKPAFDW